MSPRIASLFGTAGTVIVIHVIGLSSYLIGLNLPFTISYYEFVLENSLQLLIGIESFASFLCGMAARLGDAHTRKIGLFVIVVSSIGMFFGFCLGTFHGVYDKYHPAIYEKH